MRSSRIALITFAVLTLLSACSAAPVPNRPVTSVPTGIRSPSSGPGDLAHVVIIVDENKPATSILGNPAAPYLNALAHRFASATNYAAISHPSLPNYLALTSGTTAGISSDCNPPGGRCSAGVRNITDEVTAADRGWRMYAEGMPAPCALTNSGQYAVKHVPFLYYPVVRGDLAYCADHVVPYARFAADLATTTSLPAYSFISPNLCDDMHSCSIATGDAWLARNVPRILSSPAFTQQRSLLVVVFDEGDSANNVVPCIFAGPAARRGYTTAAAFTHYSLLRTIEIELGLGTLTSNDSAARPMTQLLSKG
jgi:acid phosphatase